MLPDAKEIIHFKFQDLGQYQGKHCAAVDSAASIQCCIFTNYFADSHAIDHAPPPSLRTISHQILTKHHGAIWFSISSSSGWQKISTATLRWWNKKQTKKNKNTQVYSQRHSTKMHLCRSLLLLYVVVGRPWADQGSWFLSDGNMGVSTKECEIVGQANQIKSSIDMFKARDG